MAHLNTVFHTLTELVSRHDFDLLIGKEEKSRKRPKITRWSQFIALLTAQILQLKSLRDIEDTQKAMRKKLCHLGAQAVSKSTLARQNDTLDASLFKKLFELLLSKCQQFSPLSKFKPKGVNKLLLMDASTISLCLSAFSWAKYRKQKGAIKIHVGIDDDGLLPVFCDLTTGKVHEIKHARNKSYPIGSVLCFDRGYADYEWWESLDEQGIYFVTRLKNNADYDQIRRRAGRRGANIDDDETIQLKGMEKWFRLVHYTDPETNIEYRFITNAEHLKAQTIADIYKERWQIELFFKWIKQNLKIKTFLGTSQNAVLTQIWIAMCVYLIISFLKFKSKTKLSIRKILNWIRLNLFTNAIIWDFLIPKQTQTIAVKQLKLF